MLGQVQGGPSNSDPPLPIRCSPHDLCHGWDLPWWLLALLQGIFLTQGSNPGLLHCRKILYWLSCQGSRIRVVLKVKEPACQCRRHKRYGFNPWVRKIPWRKAWQPTPLFLPGKSNGQRSLVGYSPRGHKESDITERLHFLSFLSLKMY